MEYPICGEKMEREDGFFWKMKRGYDPLQHLRDGEGCLFSIPAAEYYCPGCGSLWRWTRGSKPEMLAEDSHLDVVNFFQSHGQ